jgi:hypothetical protein
MPHLPRRIATFKPPVSDRETYPDQGIRADLSTYDVSRTWKAVALTRFCDVYVFGPEAALHELRRQGAADASKPEPAVSESEPETNEQRDDSAVRERALRRPWDVGPR